jgi:hypothetical protein
LPVLLFGSNVAIFSQRSSVNFQRVFAMRFPSFSRLSLHKFVDDYRLKYEIFRF